VTLRSYLDAGGRLLVFIDPTLSADGSNKSLGIENLLSEYGVEIGSDIVIDPANPLPFYGAETIFVNSFGSHPITRSLEQAQVPVIFPLARSISKGEADEGFQIEELLRTSSEGWGERDLSNLQQVGRDDSDLAGPVVLALAVSVAENEEEVGLAALESEEEPDAGEAEEQQSVEASADESPAIRLVVFGDSDSFTNGQLANVGNAELFVNTINWLVQRENLVGIAPKKPEQVRLTLSASQLRNLSWLVFGILPGMAVLMGTAVFFRRRR
jgi:ABC-type uncharacterized transport system involved in gliding motility auxiliary subunit